MCFPVDLPPLICIEVSAREREREWSAFVAIDQQGGMRVKDAAPQ